MYEDLAVVVTELADALEAALGRPVGLTPSHARQAQGGLVAFVDAPVLEPSRTRLSGAEGISLKVVLVAGGTDRDQTMALYRALPVALEAIPDSWAFQEAAPIQPVLVADTPAYQIPLRR